MLVGLWEAGWARPVGCLAGEHAQRTPEMALPQDHSRNPMGVAVTMAHEMGHNLGLDHDEDVPGCYCPEVEKNRKCVMAASIR